MKKFIIKNLLITVLFLIPICSFSKNFKIEASNKLPLEFIYLIRSYQIYDLTKKEEKSFKKMLSFYDRSFRKISKEEQYQIIKSQIYKNIINFLPIYKNKKLDLDLKEIKEKMEKNLRSIVNDPFKRWLCSALIRDIDLFIKNKNSNKNRIYYSLFYSWNNFFNNPLNQEVKDKLKALSKNIMINLKNRLKDFLLISKNISLTESKEIKIEEMVFFQIVEKVTSIEKKNSEKKSRVLKILEPINEESLILPGTIKKEDEWIPKDQKENINTSPPEPDPNYVSPEKLPIPTNDW